MKRIKKIMIITSIAICCLVLQSCATEKVMEQAKSNYAQGNYHQAFMNAEKLARYGDADAQYAIGYMYYYGLGITKDEDLARSWVRKSAKNGNADAQHALKLLTQS